MTTTEFTRPMDRVAADALVSAYQEMTARDIYPGASTPERFARWFYAQEQEQKYDIGCPDAYDYRALVYGVMALRYLCAVEPEGAGTAAYGYRRHHVHPPEPQGGSAMTATDREQDFGPDDIEQWFWVRARWVIDLLRSGLNVAVIGVSGMGKSVTMNYAETMLAEYGLTEHVRFFYTTSATPPTTHPTVTGEASEDAVNADYRSTAQRNHDASNAKLQIWHGCGDAPTEPACAASSPGRPVSTSTRTAPVRGHCLRTRVQSVPSAWTTAHSRAVGDREFDAGHRMRNAPGQLHKEHLQPVGIQ